MWQLITIVILLALMIGLQQFPLGDPNTPFNPKSLAATGFIILAAFTTGELFRKFRIPALLGYIAAGIVFGPSLAAILFSVDVGELLGASSWMSADWYARLFASGGDKALFDKSVIADLALINVLTVGVIGTMGGGELKLADIKESWKLILFIITLIIVSAIPLTMGTVVGLSYLPGGLVAFLQDEPTMSRVAAALLFAILAVAMSPAATLAILQETRAKGKFTSLVLGVVVVADLALVALFLVGFSLAKLLVAPGGFQMGALLHALPHIGMEFGWALIIGAVTGAVIILYMRFVEREMMLFTVAVIFATSYVCRMLHAETLLAFLTAGFIVQNFSRYGHALIHELETISAPVFIVYFMTQAAQLDLKPVIAYLPLTVILAVVRGLAFYGSIKIATNVSETNETTKNNLWMTFFSRGGVDLVLAAMVANAVTEQGAPAFAWGTAFQTVIMSTVVVHIVGGPPLLKFALSRAGETEESRQESAGALVGGGQEAGEATALPEPAFENMMLNAHMDELRDGLQALHQSLIAGPQEERRKMLSRNISTVRDQTFDAMRKLEELLTTDRFDTDHARLRALRVLHVQYRKNLERTISVWEHLDPLAFGAEDVAELLVRVRSLEDFETQFVVPMEQVFFDPSQAPTRAIGALRRWRGARRLIVGNENRSIPVGHLWRYYVELSLPRYLTTAAVRSGERHEEFWFYLGRYLRQIDMIFKEADRLLDGRPLPKPLLDAHEAPAHDEHGHDEHGHDEHGEDAAHEAELQATRAIICGLLADVDPRSSAQHRALELVRMGSELTERTFDEVLEHLEQSMETSTGGYAWGLSKAFGEFLDGVGKAGTWELPAHKFRASAKFDQARRAQGQLEQQLKREGEIVSAYVGWIVMDHQLTLFLSWYHDYQRRIMDTLNTLFRDQTMRQFERMQTQCHKGLVQLTPTPLPAPPDDEGADAPDAPPETLDEGSSPAEAEPPLVAWDAWLRRDLRPAGRSARRVLERALIAFGQGITSRRLIDTLEYRVAGFSEQVCLLVQDPDTALPEGRQLETMRLRVRKWFSRTLVNEIALMYVDFNNEAELLVRRNLVGLDEVEQRLEQGITEAQAHLDGLAEDADEATIFAARREANTRAEQALRDGEELLAQLQLTLTQRLGELDADITGKTDRFVERATTPFLEYRLVEVQRELGRLTLDDDESGAWAVRKLTPLVTGLRRTAEIIKPLYDELWDDVRERAIEREPLPMRERLRAQLMVDADVHFKQLPVLYWRLFNPVPLDLPEFYVPRQELERECLAAIAEWGKGRPTSLLLHGDPGVGKRTFAHNLVPIKIYDLSPTFQSTPIQTIRLGEDTTDERDLCRQLAPLVAGASIETFAGLEEALLKTTSRQIVLVENATKCYRRTPEGLAMCKRFMQLISATSQQVLWITLMEAPARTLLDAAVELSGYFTHVIEVKPLSQEAIERMILNRHRVEQFDAEFEATPLRLTDHLQRPLQSWEATRQPERTFFRALARRSGGNPMLALMLWMRAVHPSPIDDRKLLVAPMAEFDEGVTQGLSLEKLLILATLLQHGSLQPARLAEQLMLSEDEIRTELGHLGRQGFVEVMAGTNQHYRLRPVAAPQTAAALRQRNLV